MVERSFEATLYRVAYENGVLWWDACVEYVAYAPTERMVPPMVMDAERMRRANPDQLVRIDVCEAGVVLHSRIYGPSHLQQLEPGEET